MNLIKNLFRRFVAFIRRTFVASCPRCHKYFYGFHPYKTQIKLEIHYRIVCGECGRESPHQRRKVS